MRFDWDDSKNKQNIKKHKVSFEEASSVFYDEKALVSSDPEHSEDEDRFVIFGFSVQLNALIVCFCERDSGDTIRIISARKLNKKERTKLSKRRQS